MSELVRAQEPFRFFTRMNLTELTGLRASTVSQLLSLIKTVPGSCIYHHTHRFLQQHQYLAPEPPNDFAYWVIESLGEDELGEKLFSIDTVKYPNIRSLREVIVRSIEDYMRDNPLVKLKFSRAGEEFHFMKSVSFVLPTQCVVYDLKEFADCMRNISFDSIYFHIFEARLRLERNTNDFACWIETSLNNKKLADHLSRLDPYTSTLENLRGRIIRIIEREIS